MDPLTYALTKNPIIMSLTDATMIDQALNSNSHIVIVIDADINSIANICERFRETDKLILVHMDLIKGLKRDASSIQFLVESIGVDGIVTTHANLIQIAKQFGLLTIQRVFILDSASIRQGIKSINKSQPTAVEILPGIAVPHINSKLKPHIKQSIIAAGLIDTKDEIEYVLANGAQGISSSSYGLWNIYN